MTGSLNCFKKRLNRFRSEFKKGGVEGFVVEDPTDLYYFTGLRLSRGRLLIGPSSATLFVDGRYMENAKKESPISVKELNEKELVNQLKKWGKVTHFGFDTSLTIAAHRELKKGFLKGKKHLKGFDFPTQKIRAIKDKEELLLLKKSADLLWKGFLQIQKKLKVGITECELAREFEFYVKNLGAEALSFEPIIAFGENSALPHHHPGNRKLKKGDVVLVDIGVVLNQYASDMTRVLFFGDVPKRILEIYEVVRKAHKEAIKGCKPGVHVSELDKIARKVMGKEEKYFIHALGHGIGLDVHEYPRIGIKSKNIILEEGMVITIEPGLYLPGIGGIRYEDMLVITKTGCKNLFQE